jgi:fluoride ion exporter CrcB/FEX
MDSFSLVLGFVVGVLWSAAVGILLLGYFAMKYAGQDIETPRATQAHYMIAAGMLGIFMVWSFAKNGFDGVENI